MCKPMGPFEIILSIVTVLSLLYIVGAVIVGLFVSKSTGRKGKSAQGKDNFIVRAGRNAWTEPDRDGLTTGARLVLMVVALIVIIIIEAIF